MTYKGTRYSLKKRDSKAFVMELMMKPEKDGFSGTICACFICRPAARNLTEMVWKKAKYHRQCFINWSKETLESEQEKLLGALW